MHLEGTAARPVNVVLNEMERVPQNHQSEKLSQYPNLSDLTHEKRKGKLKSFGTQQVVKWQFMHDAKIPRIIDMESYLKNTKAPTAVATSNPQWNFSSDESLDRHLNQNEVMSMNYVSY